MVGRIECDALERALDQESRQRRHQAYPKSRAHQPERYLVGAAMRDQTVRWQDVLVPLLDAQRVLRAEMELDAVVEHAHDVSGRLVEACKRAKVDRARNREYIRIIDDRDLPKADAGLRHRALGDQADMRLPRIEHIDDLARRSLMDVELDAGTRPPETRHGTRTDGLDRGLWPGYATTRP